MKKYDGYLVHILPTQRCNLQCEYCYSDALYADNRVSNSIDENYIESVANLINSLPITIIHLEGGEPLLFEGIYSLIDKIECKEKIYLVTNGYLLNDVMAKKLKECGLKNAIVSIDYASGASVKKKSCIRSLELLKRVGMHTEISVTMLKDNMSEMEALFEVAAENDIDRIRFGEIVRVGAAQKNNIMYLTSKDYELIIPKFLKISAKYPNIDSALSLNGNIYDECEDTLKKRYDNEFKKRKCNMSETMITIDEMGDIYTCCNLIGKKSFLIGSVYDPWEEILCSENYENIRNMDWKNCPVGRGYHLIIEGGRC